MKKASLALALTLTVATLHTFAQQPPPPPPPGGPGPGPAPQDPGVRGGAPGAGGTFPILDDTSTEMNALDKAFFTAARSRFQVIDSVSGTIEPGFGLGPSFNGNSCVMCHAQPSTGGSSPRVNPQVANSQSTAHH